MIHKTEMAADMALFAYKSRHKALMMELSIEFDEYDPEDHMDILRPYTKWVDKFGNDRRCYRK